MPDNTTIKVPRTLRDRIAERAEREHVSLATVIARALDESETRAFWSAVTAEHAQLTAADRSAYLSDPTLADSVADTDDGAVSSRGGW